MRSGGQAAGCLVAIPLGILFVWAAHDGFDRVQVVGDAIVVFGGTLFGGMVLWVIGSILSKKG